jgi:hypothetical protein
MIKLLPQTILFVLVFGAFSVFAQPAAYTDGKAAQLSAQQISSLKKLKAAVAVPTYIPRGYTLDKVDIEKPDALGTVFFGFIYKNAAGKTVMVQSGNDGLGDIPYDGGVKGNNPYFDGVVEAGFDEDKRVIVTWISSKRKFQPKGVKVAQSYSLIADERGISRQEAAKIMSSLRYLK